MKARLLSLSMALLIVLCQFVPSVQAAGLSCAPRSFSGDPRSAASVRENELRNVNVSGVCGDALTWSFDFEDGALTIEGSGDMYDYQYYDPVWEYDDYSRFPPWYIFADAITAISLPDGLTKIGSGAFSSCFGLTKVTVPEGVVSIGDRAFYNCTSLQAVTLPESLKQMGSSVFNTCTSLSSVTIPGQIRSVPYGCFYGCQNLSSVIFPEDLYEILQNAFLGCSALTALDLPENLSSIGSFAFSGCTGLTELNLPDNLSSIDNAAFRDCTGLTAVTFPASLTSLGEYVFSWCGSILSYCVDADNPVYSSDSQGALYDREKTRLILYPTGRIGAYAIPESVTEIGPNACSLCAGLTAVSFPEGLAVIGSNSFSGCTGLTELLLPEALSRIGYNAFEGCTELRMLKLPGEISEAEENVFLGCTGLKTVIFSEGLSEIPFGMFSGCTGLTGLSFPEGLTTIGPWAFSGCTGLTVLVFPEGLTIIGDSAFSGCSGLTELHFPNSLTAIGDSAFYQCVGLTSVSLPESLTYLSGFNACTALTEITIPKGVSTIGHGAFSGCTGLASVSLPEELISIRELAFSECTGLTSLRIPDGTTDIRYYAFSGCTGLRSARLPGSLRRIETGAFSGCTSLSQLVLENPDCLVCCGHEPYGPYAAPASTSLTLQKAEERQLRSTGYEVDVADSLGIPSFTTVYGKHDTELENAEPIHVEVDPFLYRYLESYAKHYGYSFFATNVFDDVKEGKYYEIPVAWAYGKGITTGTGERTFSPGQTCTREQIVTFLYNAAGKPGYTLTENPFTDVKAGKWYYDAVMWAYENEITSGVGDGLFGVGQGCTREQVVTFLWKALGSPEPETAECPFEDVKPGRYYYKAVLWAVENGITSGTSPTTFGPKDTCTRAQIVTFLYKAYVEIR